MWNKAQTTHLLNYRPQGSWGSDKWLGPGGVLSAVSGSHQEEPQHQLGGVGMGQGDPLASLGSGPWDQPQGLIWGYTLGGCIKGLTDALWEGRYALLGQVSMSVQTYADFLKAFPWALPLPLHCIYAASPHPHFFPPFTYESPRLSRILGMGVLAAAESELSHFTDRTVVRVSILSKVTKQDCEHCKKYYLCKESYEYVIWRTRQPGDLFWGRCGWWWDQECFEGSDVHWAFAVYDSKAKLLSSLPENTWWWGILKFLRFGFLVWEPTTMVVGNTLPWGIM